MSGNRIGGLRAAAKNKLLHGADFYARIGAKGGKLGHTGGFAANPERAKLAGAIGGAKSKRKANFDYILLNLDGYEVFRGTVYDLAKISGYRTKTIYQYARVNRRTEVGTFMRVAK